MHAAVVTSFDSPPRYSEYRDPVAEGPHDMVVDVVAAGLHMLVKSRAAGTHYSAGGALPLVPGVDAVVRDAEGNLRYAALDDVDLGTFAERTVIDHRRSVLLPAGIDPVRIAAGMNPATSWVALRRRIAFRPGQSVAILGATGSAGRMAVQISKHFGASRVVAVGRDASQFAELRALGADEAITFDEVARAADVDVVIDYVWGEPSAQAMMSIVRARGRRAAPLDWIEIGSVAGPDLMLPGALLRAARLQICGSGIGSIGAADFIAELPELADALHAGVIDVQARAVPLSRVAETWNGPARPRIVYVP